MNSIKFKIKSYDEVSNSLIVSFASDTTVSQDPDAYTALAFNPLIMWPDITDIEELKQQLAIAGVHQAALQETKEQFDANPARIAALQALVGQTYEYNVADLDIPAVDETPLQTV